MKGGEATEIRLEPEELGRVVMTLRGDERSMTLHISAERQETLELLRRQIEGLSRELADLGYSDVDVRFGGPGDQPGDPSGQEGSGTPGSIAEPAPDGAAAGHRNAITHDGSLDLRL